jgi:hypothetical protein
MYDRHLLRKENLPVLIYFLGMFPLGYFEGTIRAWLGDLLSFVTVVGYLIVLRLLGVAAVRTAEWRKQIEVAKHNSKVAAKKQARTRGS